MIKEWTPAEEQFLKDNMDMTMAQQAQHLGRTVGSICGKRARMGLTKKTWARSEYIVYVGDEPVFSGDRYEVATELGITLNALDVRVHRERKGQSPTGKNAITIAKLEGVVVGRES